VGAPASETYDADSAAFRPQVAPKKGSAGSWHPAQRSGRLTHPAGGRLMA